MDSKTETLEHIKLVNNFMLKLSGHLLRRAREHDASKLEEPEKSMFDEVTGRLRGLTYGSDEYKAALKDLKPALDHHYLHNSHHPEHHSRGIDDMCLLDLVEMFCDWCAATERHEDGDIERSIEHNQERFGMSDQLCRIFRRTARWYDMGKRS